MPNAVDTTKLCTSTKIGRTPSRYAIMADPVSSSDRSASKVADGLRSSPKPSSSMVNNPDSEVDPKRFLIPRKIRN